ncbi:GlsB/YeaQ/YmgE family stress response membrane protein [Actinokineospora sp. NBRC 105648]|uniref:GlsB/YeaQ/YmgE family stress response membrane protein n=1 Tax=Actinokineospora sp. NBRC 105648 TaxID=3032206 RepID=UPI0024A12E20|nr:GlsB/YeaQ/YmgE family stress response membrane protein [Actinokineospora sp. NBRC 105648]GLZ37509.1 transglycosylase [Actinokineospora sp. NBRC 105648]
MGIGGIISAIVVGAILGVVGRALAPGEQRIPWWLTILTGIVAAFVGTLLAKPFGWDKTSGIDFLEIVLQVIVAVVAVTLVAGIYGKSGRGHAARH